MNAGGRWENGRGRGRVGDETIQSETIFSILRSRLLVLECCSTHCFCPHRPFFWLSLCLSLSLSLSFQFGSKCFLFVLHYCTFRFFPSSCSFTLLYERAFCSFFLSHSHSLACALSTSSLSLIQSMSWSSHPRLSWRWWRLYLSWCPKCCSSSSCSSCCCYSRPNSPLL